MRWEAVAHRGRGSRDISLIVHVRGEETGDGCSGIDIETGFGMEEPKDGLVSEAGWSITGNVWCAVSVAHTF